MTCTGGWLLHQKFELGIDAKVPVPIMPESIIRGIHSTGYYIWRGWPKHA
jgi:hypothetical protein